MEVKRAGEDGSERVTAVQRLGGLLAMGRVRGRVLQAEVTEKVQPQVRKCSACWEVGVYLGRARGRMVRRTGEEEAETPRWKAL